MREHEVPTHVQAEDRVLLGFTFPQVVGMVAVCALSYGAYRFVPVGPSEVRMAIAVLFGLVGLVAVAGKIGGRQLPLVAADLLKYRLGARLYVGPPSHLVRSEPPAPVQPASSGPSPLRLMVKRAVKAVGKLSRRRKGREKTGGRMPFRPHRRFGKPGRSGTDKDVTNGNEDGGRRAKSRKLPGIWSAAVVAVALAAVTIVPQAALADDHEPWWGEVDFEINEPVPGRRIFIEGLTVSGDRVAVTLRAATDIDLRVRAFGGPEGTWLRFWGSAFLGQGERIDYSLPLDGPAPSFTFSWEDGLGQAGAFTVDGEWIPNPLPEIQGELCDLRVTSLGWTPGVITGVVESACEASTREPVELRTVAGHRNVTQTALMEAEVRAITGTLSASTGASQASVPFVPNGDTRFTLPVGVGQAVHTASMSVNMEASLRIPMPPLTRLTHHPERTERITRTVGLWRPGARDTASETITVTHDDGTTTEHTVTATAHIPGTTIDRDVTITIVHPEHVKAEVVERSPIGQTRNEALSLASRVGSDDPFQNLTVPEPEPGEEHGEQTSAGGPGSGLGEWFRWLGWEWPW